MHLATFTLWTAALWTLAGCSSGKPAVDDTADDTGVVSDTDTDTDSDTDTDGDTDTDTDTDTSTGVDADGDGYTSDVDCDDADADVNPAATEVCNEVDDNCDGEVDVGAVDAHTWYPDADGDGYGDPGAAIVACTQPADTISDYRDCNDANPDVNPEAIERCDGTDENCNGTLDDEEGTVLWVPSTGAAEDLTTALSLGTSATPITLGDSDGADYAISDGTLYFCSGVYNAKIVIADPATNLSVVSRYGATKTTLTTDGTTGGAEGSIVAVQNATVLVRGLTLTGGTGSNGSKGGAVAVEQNTGGALPSAPNLKLEDCILTGNETEYGGAIAVNNYGWIELDDTLVVGNNGSVAGGGVWVQNSGRVTCNASALGAGGFRENTSPIAGALYFSSATSGDLLSTGCDWGSEADGDDNAEFDIQRNPYASHLWCYGNAASTSASLTCVADGCSGPTDGACG